MCDIEYFHRRGWRGWSTFPAAHPPTPGLTPGPWIDLTHPLDENDASPPVFPAPRFSRVSHMPEHPLNTTQIQMVCHIGTHIDAPCHVLEDGPDIGQIPLQMLHGPGVVWQIHGGDEQMIDVAALERARPLMCAGDIVLIDTGWSKHWGVPAYYGDDHLCLTTEAAQWLVDHGVKMLGIDVPTPDLPLGRRQPGFDWPVHQILLGNGRLVMENVKNLGMLCGHKVEIMAFSLNVKDADGAPARVIARTLQSGISP